MSLLDVNPVLCLSFHRRAWGNDYKIYTTEIDPISKTPPNKKVKYKFTAEDIPTHSMHIEPTTMSLYAGDTSMKQLKKTKAMDPMELVLPKPLMDIKCEKALCCETEIVDSDSPQRRSVKMFRMPGIGGDSLLSKTRTFDDWYGVRYKWYTSFFGDEYTCIRVSDEIKMASFSDAGNPFKKYRGDLFIYRNVTQKTLELIVSTFMMNYGLEWRRRELTVAIIIAAASAAGG